jgi:4-oxalocrotonate tautomerase
MHPHIILAQARSQTRIGIHIVPQFSHVVFRARLAGWIFMEDIQMPDVHISWLEGRTADQKRKVAERIMQVLSEEAGAKPEATHIVFVDVPATNFTVGGVPHADRLRKS